MASAAEKRRDRRNLNPTAPALIAMCIWGKRYSEQNGGSMDFWDKLREPEKAQCRRLAVRIQAAPMSE